uniref:mediator of RNA polymerase II transcription subunit 15a-like n=1 Tax=Erigeron canadensis TaxID=72917 RepID=UPI001CB96847|nr:mediator of RNA polymerase II transcription subunit 15a-like [Erigeron canadensis]
MESVDWRTDLPPDQRIKVVDKIINTLMKTCSGLEKPHQLRDMAIMCEEKIYAHAKSKNDYIHTIGTKLQKICQKFKATGNPENPSDPGIGSEGMQQAHNQGQPPHVPGQFNHPQAGNQILPHNIHMNIASSSGLQPSRSMSLSTVPNNSTENSSLQNIQNIQNMSIMANTYTQNSSLQNIQNMSIMRDISSHNSSLQNMPIMPDIASHNSSLQNIQKMTMGQSIRIPSTINTIKRQIPGSQQQSQNSQHHRDKQQLHQIANQQFQQNIDTTSVQSHIQQQNLMQPTYFQPSQQYMQPTTIHASCVSNSQQNQQPIFLQSGQPVIQYHQQSGIKQDIQQKATFLESVQPVIQHHQQSVIKQERQQPQHPPLMGQQNNLSNIQQNSIVQRNNLSVYHQQHLGPQSSQNRQQHQLVGTQSGNSAMLNNQYSARLVQSMQSQRLQEQAIPQIQSGQLYHQSNIKPEVNMSQGDMQQRLPTSQDLQQQNVLNQQQQLSQQQRAMPETSSIPVDPVSTTGVLNSGDWQEEAYQKIKTAKDKYMPWFAQKLRKFMHDLNILQHDFEPQKPPSKQFMDLQKYKQMLENFMKFLLVSKTNIPPNYKENLGKIESFMSRFLSKRGVTRQQQPLIAPHINSPHQLQQTQNHLTQVQPHENQIPSQMQSVDSQHSNMSGLQNNNMDFRQPTSNMLQPHQLKQIQDREMQRQQLLHEQIIFNQQHQLHPRTKQQQQPNRNQITNGKELEVRQQTGIKSQPIKQQKLSGYQQQFPSSSAQIDKQNLLNSATKSGTALQYANSLIMVSSPSTPYTSHRPIKSKKVNYGNSSLSNAAGNVGHQTTGVTLPSQPLANATTGISTSPLLSECKAPDGNHHGYGASKVYETSAVVPPEEGQPSAVPHPRTLPRQNQDASCLASTIEDPMEHLLRVVKSMSPKSLTSAVSDISSALSTIDSIVEADPGDGSIGEDLAAMTKSHLQRPFASKWEATATSTMKRPRIERRHPLLDEIREINQGLIDTVVDITQEDDVDPATALGVGKGIVVKCSFSTVALDPNLKSQYASESSPIQPLRLLVPATYPNCSPLLLDEFPDEVSKECDDLSLRVKCQFRSSVERFKHPVSLSEMVRAWNACARIVIMEYAQKSGGGTFTSKYGAWKDCLTTA